MPDALIGHTGFVWSNLVRQMPFDEFYNSKNIDDIRGRKFGLVVCAAAPGAKWHANQHPREDWSSIARLQQAVNSIHAERFVLISTIDVYSEPRGVDENTPCTTKGLHWYGINRLVLEIMIRQQFDNRATIVRLPALFGKGLKKNALYDLMRGNDVEKIPANAMYQWYDVGGLGADLRCLVDSGYPLVNIVSAPIKMSVIRNRYFIRQNLGENRMDAARYDVGTIYPIYRTGARDLLREMGEWLTSEMSTAVMSPELAMRAAI